MRGQTMSDAIDTTSLSAAVYRLRDQLEARGRPVAELDALTVAAAELDYVAEGLRITEVMA